VRLVLYLLPVFAFGIVALAVGGAIAIREDSPGASPAVTETATPTPEETSPPSARPRFSPEGNVCQGILHRPEPGSPRQFPAFYTQQREVLGFMIVAGPDVPAEAIDVAEATIREVFVNEDLRQPLVDEGAYVAIAAAGQRPQELPEFACLVEELGEGFFTHVCGIADRADYPLVTVNAADLMGERRGPCAGLNVLYHELGHLVHGWDISPADYLDVRVYYQDAVNSGLYSDAYAMQSPGEYFAEGTQAYFDVNDDQPHDRAWLEENDPQLFEMLERIYGH
jgi:hypothetical protein